jgi:hypothetical protein
MAAGPLLLRRCSACRLEFFGGGLPFAMVVLCIALPIGAVLSTVFTSFAWFVMALLVAFAFATWHMYNAPLLPPGRRWSEALKVFAPVFVLWLGFEALKLMK